MSSDGKQKIFITKRTLFYWILRRHRLLQFFLLLVILTSLFFRVFPLEMQKRIINEAIHLKNLQLLYLYCGLYIGAVVLASTTKYAINVMQTILGQKILVEIRTELYDHVLQLPLQFYRKMQPGTVISAMTSELNGIGFFLGGALAIPVTSVLTFAVFLGFMISLSPLLAIRCTIPGRRCWTITKACRMPWSAIARSWLFLTCSRTICCCPKEGK
jgi:putative ABC transport system ATP-binding protein